MPGLLTCHGLLELVQTDKAQECLAQSIKNTPYLCMHVLDAHSFSVHSQILRTNQIF